MKKIIAVLTVYVLLFELCVGVTAVSGKSMVYAGSAVVSAGNTAQLPLVLTGNTGFSDLSIEISYDTSILTLRSVKNNTGIIAVYTESSDMTANPYNMNWTSAKNVDFNGTLAMLNFEVKENAPDGEYPITVDYYKGRDGKYTDGESVNYDESFNPLNLEYADGTVTVSSDTDETDETLLLKNPSVKIEDVYAEAGKTVQVPVILMKNKGFSNLGIEINYNTEVMTLRSAENNIRVGGEYTAEEDINSNPYNMSWNSTENIPFNGTLATLTFEIAADAPDGKYPITVDYYKGRDGGYTDGESVNYDENFKSLNLNYSNGTVNVVSVNSIATVKPFVPQIPTAEPTQKPNAAVEVGSVTAVKSDNIIEVPVNLKNNTGFIDLGLEIGYNSKIMKLKSVKNNLQTDALYTGGQDINANPYNLGWSGSENIDYNGTLAMLNFEVKENAPDGEYPITVDYYKGRDGKYTDGVSVNYDIDFTPLDLTYTDGEIIINTSGTDTPISKKITISTVNTAGKTGESINVPIAISNNSGFCSLGIEVAYDSSALTLVGCTPQNAVGAVCTAAQDIGKNPYNLIWNSAAENNTYNGILANLEFKINSDAKSGTYPINIGYYKGFNGTYIDGEDINYDFDFNALDIEYINGDITVIGQESDAPVNNAIFAKKQLEDDVLHIYTQITSADTEISGYVITAVYTSDKKLFGVKTASANKENSFEFENTEEINEIKVMWWKDFNNILPMVQPAVPDMN